MRRFLVISLSQGLALLGSHLTIFALGVWLFQRTGSTTLNGWISLASIAPAMLAAPLAGALVDRGSPRAAMLSSHAGAAACSLLLVLLHGMGWLNGWTLLPVVVVTALFDSLQYPGLSVAMTMLVPPEQLGRANGLLQLSMAASQVLAPAASGLLLEEVGLGGILAINVLTFLVAAIALLTVHIPKPQGSAGAAAQEQEALAVQVSRGWRFIRERPGLLLLTLLPATAAFNMGMLQILVTPLVLSFTDAKALGLVLTVGGVGMVAGSALLTAWGGPRQQVVGVLGALLLQGVVLLLAAGAPSVMLAAAGAFGVMFTFPLISGCAQTIWQRKVPARMQGSVLSVRRVLVQATLPLAYLVAGPLADRVFEPLMADGGGLSASLGSLLGVGPGRGVALMLVLLAVLTVSVTWLSALSPRLRRIEQELPEETSPAQGEAPVPVAAA